MAKGVQIRSFYSFEIQLSFSEKFRDESRGLQNGTMHEEMTRSRTGLCSSDTFDANTLFIMKTPSN